MTRSSCTAHERVLIEAALEVRRFRLRDDWAEIVSTSDGVRRYGRLLRLEEDAADVVLAEWGMP